MVINYVVTITMHQLYMSIKMPGVDGSGKRGGVITWPNDYGDIINIMHMIALNNYYMIMPFIELKQRQSHTTL